MARIIKKYANRKLYDTVDRRYVSLPIVETMVAAGEEVTVLDQVTGDDITGEMLGAVSVSGVAVRPRRDPAAPVTGTSGAEPLGSALGAALGAIDTGRRVAGALFPAGPLLRRGLRGVGMIPAAEADALRREVAGLRAELAEQQRRAETSDLVG